MDNKEMVNHPQHYNKGQYECIEVMRDIFGDEEVAIWCKLNAFKYAWRQDNKDGLQDVEKLIWYSKKYLELNGK